MRFPPQTMLSKKLSTIKMRLIGYTNGWNLKQLWLKRNTLFTWFSNRKAIRAKKSGKYRPGDIYVVDQRGDAEIIQYVGPDAQNVSQLVDTFLTWVHLTKTQTKLHPVLLAGLIHYIFVSIHPFSDGNGRTSRFLTYQFLKSVTYDFNDSLSLDSYYLQNRENYYQALSRGKTFDERMFVDITPFLDFFVKGFLTSVKSLTKIRSNWKSTW